MTIANISSLIQYTASAGQIEFPFPFRVFANEDVKVYKTPAGQTVDPIADLLTLGIDYTVVFLSESDGGYIVLVIPAVLNDVITIQRDLSVDRPTDYGDTGDFTGKSIDNQLDKLTGIQKDIKSLIQERGLLYPINEQVGLGQTTLPKLPAGYIWKANGDGNLVAAECVDEEGCSTLRSELASQAVLAPGTDIVGYYDKEELTGKTLTEFLNNIAPQNDSRPLIKNAVDETKRVKIDASNVGTGQTRKIIMPDTDVNLGEISGQIFPPEFLRGGKVDFVNTFTITVNPVKCIDKTDVIDLILAAAMTKIINASWVQGNGNGGLSPTLILAPGTFYFPHVIGKAGATEIDIGIDDTVDGSRILTDLAGQGYIYSRRLPIAFYADSSSTIKAFINEHVAGQSQILWKSPAIDLNGTANPGITAVFTSLTIPPYKVVALVNSRINNVNGVPTNRKMYISSTSVNDDDPISYYNMGIHANKEQAIEYPILAATQQVRTRLDSSDINVILTILTKGWNENIET